MVMTEFDMSQECRLDEKCLAMVKECRLDEECLAMVKERASSISPDTKAT